ncbi:FAD binding domain protein [Bordetella holmesii 70147]|nr:FAD binding domain protein [Bordetella holmesii ATCC 51541]EWM45604.1 FAD binding domain protein [Bordetella holmesii 70147]
MLTATRISPAIFHTQGGLTVDADGGVLRRDGSRIAGLWAGGGAASGISGNKGSLGYMSGNGLLAALGLGWRIGQVLAAELNEATP